MAVCSTEFKNLKQIEDDLKETRKSRIAALESAAKRQGIVDDFQKSGTNIKDAQEWLSSLLRGSNKFGRDSVESSYNRDRALLSSTLENEVYKNGYKQVAIKGALDRDISDAMFKISNGQDPGTGPAADLAKIYSKAIDEVRDRQNKVGGDIGDAKNYVTRTEWDAVKMRQAAGINKTLPEAFDAWWSTERPRMSDKTFESVKPRPGQTMAEAEREFGQYMFESFLTGIHERVGLSETGIVPKELQGTSNIRDRVSAHRAIVWKDGQSWHDHMQDFGKSQTLYQSVMNTINRGTKATALMDRFGANPSANLNLVVNRLKEMYKSDADGVNKFQGDVHYTVNEMKQLDGTANIPANMGLDQFTSAVLAGESSVHLGGVGITHLVSVTPTFVSEAAQHGINRISAMKELAQGLMTGRSSQELRDLQTQLGAYGDSAARHSYSQIDAPTNGGVPGMLSSWAGKVVEMSGIHLILDRSQAAMRGMLANNLAENLTKSFDELEPHLQNMLGKYRITPEEWESLRGLEQIHTYNGRNYLTPASVLEGLGGRYPEDFKNNLADKIGSYYSDAALHSTVTPGVRERALLNFGTQRGTAANTFARFFTQFKAWPLALYHQALERDIYMSLSAKDATMNIGTLIAMGVPLGYMRSSVMNMIAGRPADDPRNPTTWMNAAKESGMLGLMGDMMFGQTYKMAGSSPLVSFAGPVANDLDQIWKIYNNGMQDTFNPNVNHKNGQYADVWPELAHFGVNHLPFANLVYLKGALDYMAWYHVYEAVDPGWWERTNRRLDKEQKRTMAGYVPGGGVPYGIPGVYLSSQNDKQDNE